ncbi:hypothetical protein CLFE_017050 [Clostridium felsineum DSM 794]|nr:hypothetical protein CLFE_017050 [Clostridium felsineum DSM 794]
MGNILIEAKEVKNFFNKAIKLDVEYRRYTKEAFQDLKG